MKAAGKETEKSIGTSKHDVNIQTNVARATCNVGSRSSSGMARATTRAVQRKRRILLPTGLQIGDAMLR